MSPATPAGFRHVLVAAGAIASGLVAWTLAGSGDKAVEVQFGSLAIDVEGNPSAIPASLQVLVDGSERCTGMPCLVGDLTPGKHEFVVRGEDFEDVAVRDVEVVAGGTVTKTVALTPRTARVNISAVGEGLWLYVDDRLMGDLPQLVEGLRPGTHELRVEGERYETWRKNLTLNAGVTEFVGPLKLAVTSGLAHVEAADGAAEARVLVECGADGSRRVVPPLPVSLQLNPSDQCTLIATRPGYAPYRQALTFADGEAVRTFKVALTPEGSPVQAVPTSAVPVDK